MNSHGDHSDLWDYIDGLREDLGRAEERIRELEHDLRDALERIHALEDRLPGYGGEDDRADEARDLAREDGDYDDCEPTL
jgi:hypothetical protein